MNVTGRGSFQRAAAATVISICAIFDPAVLGHRPHKVFQHESTEAIANHRAWLEGQGTRAVFRQPQFVGLDFRRLDGSNVVAGFSQTSLHGANLSSAKFNSTNLSDVNF
jgi:uncharacterized protein YjbI with pentapeptide repeats